VVYYLRRVKFGPRGSNLQTQKLNFPITFSVHPQCNHSGNLELIHEYGRTFCVHFLHFLHRSSRWI